MTPADHGEIRPSMDQSKRDFLPSAPTGSKRAQTQKSTPDEKSPQKTTDTFLKPTQRPPPSGCQSKTAHPSAAPAPPPPLETRAARQRATPSRSSGMPVRVSSPRRWSSSPSAKTKASSDSKGKSHQMPPVTPSPTSTLVPPHAMMPQASSSGFLNASPRSSRLSSCAKKSRQDAPSFPQISITPNSSQ